MIDGQLYQIDLREFLAGVDWVNPYAVTLTMSTNAWRDTSQNFRHFLNRLNQSYLDNRYRRYGERLSVVPIIEGTANSPIHYHCIIDNPYPDRDEAFLASIRQSWWTTELSKPEINIQRMHSDGWITYITKLRTKTDFTSCVDWQNTYF